MALILIVDDDHVFSTMMTHVVRRMGHEIHQAGTLTAGADLIVSGHYDLVLLDVNLPDGNGLDFIPRFQGAASAPEVIIVTGSAEPDGAELAMKSGAWAYVQKGQSLDAMTLPLVRALQYREEKNLVKSSWSFKREGLVGRTPALMAVLEQMARAAHSEASVLIVGETGTGKELLARAIHANSRRSQGEFVVVDCAALPETLVESVLFGHVRGAFTGAEMTREGLVAQADRGTLFLDEVGELPLTMQKQFLRVLQERTFRPVGGGKEIPSDFRLVAATNQDLEAMVRAGRFRSDLLFRLQTFVLPTPTLRECRDDIKDLAAHYIGRFCERGRIGTKGYTPEFLEALMAYDWPGNVRELVHAIERAVAEAHDEPTLHVKHLPDRIRVFVARRQVAVDGKGKTEPEAVAPEGGVGGEAVSSKAVGPRPAPLAPFHEYRDSLERRYLVDLLELVGGEIGEAVRTSGLSRSRLYDLLKKHGLSRAG